MCTSERLFEQILSEFGNLAGDGFNKLHIYGRRFRGEPSHWLTEFVTDLVTASEYGDLLAVASLSAMPNVERGSVHVRYDGVALAEGTPKRWAIVSDEYKWLVRGSCMSTSSLYSNPGDLLIDYMYPGMQITADFTMTLQALRRPDGYEHMSPEAQWEIDRDLGILDWDGT